MPDVIHTCKGCNDEYINMDASELSFDYCCECEIEICMNCGRDINGKKYCQDCTPLITNQFDRSVE